jgi:hypothetical protein
MRNFAKLALILVALAGGGCGDQTADDAAAPEKSQTNVEPVAANDAAPSTAMPKPDTAAPAEQNERFASWAGTWTGPEGLYLTITPTGNETFKLEMQSDLDTKGRYDGKAQEHGISFVRDGKSLSLHQTDGDETGLKYLAGKKECLTVKPGEGYCRD